MAGVAGGGQDEMPVGMLAVQQHGGGQKHGREVLDFGMAAAGHQGDDGALRRQPQFGASCALIGVERNLVGQRVATVGGGNAGLAVDGFLEREDQQHVVGGLTDFLDALAPPRPDGGADEVPGAHAGGTQAGFEAKVEVGGIDTDEATRRPVEQALRQLAANPQQLRQHLEGLGVAVHGQQVAGPPGLEAGSLHAGTTDAGRLHEVAGRCRGHHVGRGCRLAWCRIGRYIRRGRIRRGDSSLSWFLLLPVLQHRRREQVTRGLARDHADPRAHALSAQCRVWPRPGTAPADRGTSGAARQRQPAPAAPRGPRPATGPDDRASCRRGEWR